MLGGLDVDGDPSFLWCLLIWVMVMVGVSFGFSVLHSHQRDLWGLDDLEYILISISSICLGYVRTLFVLGIFHLE